MKFETDSEKDLRELREAWEKGMTVLSELTPYPDTMYVTLQESDTKFRLHRYFTIGKKWEISVDAENQPNFEKISEILKRKNE